MSVAISQETATRETGRLPSWLKGFNRVITALQRLGFVVGSMYVLTVPGRRSGVSRSTPVSLLTVEWPALHRGRAGIMPTGCSMPAHAGRGMLHRGRTEEHVSLIELPVEDRAPILREFPRLIPQGVPFFTRLYGVGADPEAFAALAARCPVFRVERR